jgi:hypothetical protein
MNSCTGNLPIVRLVSTQNSVETLPEQDLSPQTHCSSCYPCDHCHLQNIFRERKFSVLLFFKSFLFDYTLSKKFPLNGAERLYSPQLVYKLDCVSGLPDV